MAKNATRKAPGRQAASARRDPPSSIPDKRPEFGSVPLILLILLAGTVAFANSFKGAFVFDDHGHIVNSDQIRSLRPVSTWLAQNARPVVTLTLALNYHFDKLETRGYHAVNLLIHLVAALTLFGILRRTLRREPMAATFGPAAPWLACVICVLWVVHPLQTQSVTYVIQRGESLMGLFYLLTLYGFIRAVETGGRSWAWFLVSILFCVLGLASKAVMVVAPLLVLLYDRVFVGQGLSEILRRRWAYYLGLLLTLTVVQLVGLFNSVLNPNPGYAVSAGFGMTNITWWGYLRTQPEVILHYLRLVFWPHPLCLDYEWPVAQSGYYEKGFLILLMLVVTGSLLWKRPRLGFVAASFFIILGPSSSFIPVKDLAMEHRMYLPLASVIILVVLGAYALLVRVASKPLPTHLLAGSAALVFMMTGVLAAATHQRNKVYYNSDAIWRNVTLNFPQNPRAWNNFGEGLSAAGQKMLTAAQEAKAMAQQAKDQGKEDVAQRWLAEASARQQDYVAKLTEAARAFAQAIRVKPDLPDAHYNLGKAYYELGRFPEAIEHYQFAKRFAPHDLPSFIMLGNLYVDQGRLPEAEHEFRLAIQAAMPDTDNSLLARAYFNLGNTLARQNKIAESINEYRQAIKTRPQYANGYYGLGWAFQQLGRLAEAKEAYESALRWNPDYPEARNGLATVLKFMQQPSAGAAKP